MSVAFDYFKQRFPVTWTSLLAGWRGFGQLRRLVTTSDIAQFALEKLEATPGSDSNLAELANISEADATEIDSHLAQLASSNPDDYQAEVRKWTISLLEKQLRELPNDPLYGLVRLTEFWAALDFPDYSPHQVQGKGNTLSPTEYYTQENYANALAKHKEWMGQESIKLSRRVAGP